MTDYCTEPDTQGRQTYRDSRGKTQTGYVWCTHGSWSSPELAGAMHRAKPDMPRGYHPFRVQA